MSTPRCSVILPAYNAARTLDACLRACNDQSLPPVEIIVVDDGSTDETPEIARAHPVVYLRQQNAGPAAARNFGAQHAQGDWLVFTDADCLPRRDWLAQLASHMTDGVDAVGGTYDIANPASLLARLIQAEIATRHARMSAEVDFLGSFNVAYRREAFRAVGGFDAWFTRASAEDNDLAYRLHDRGARLVFAPTAVVAHHHPVRLGPYLRTQTRHGFWRVQLYRKHRGRAQRGDRYASSAEMLTVPLVLLALVAAALAQPIAALLPAIYLVPALALLAATLLHLPTWGGVIARTGPEGLLFLPLALLRDAARGLGLIGGFLRPRPRKA